MFYQITCIVVTWCCEFYNNNNKKKHDKNMFNRRSKAKLRLECLQSARRVL